MITIHKNECKSTQNSLIEYCSDIKEFEKIIISSSIQTEGIGRSDNSWHHFPNSFACSFTLIANEVITLSSLELGVLISGFLNNKFKIETKLKWPNDIFYNEKKLGGIIIYNNSKFLICGVGINFKANDRKDFSYSALDINFDESLYSEFYAYILSHRLTSDEVISQWQSQCLHMNKTVQIDDKYQGKFIGIGKNGQALIQKGPELLEEYSASLTLC